MHLLSIDIGSTWTKGAVFKCEHGMLSFKDGYSLPTTTEHLPDAFFNVAKILKEKIPSQKDDQVIIRCSSSAKGGLSVAAIGIVPDLTLKTAHQTALSAGSRINKIYAYELTEKDIRSLDTLNPDILLFSGGTDGGNKKFVRNNTDMLKTLSIRPHIIYAGNKVMSDYVRKTLNNFTVHTTENILPDLNKPNPEPARSLIREIFINSITHGKGLDTIEKYIKAPILPTPYVVYELIKAISDHIPEWEAFCAVDMGGATTDVYSAGKACHFSSNSFNNGPVVLKGVPEMNVSRTVEGDLGMRVSALSTFESRAHFLRSIFSNPVFSKHIKSHTINNLENYIFQLSQNPSSIPSGDIEKFWDRLLAASCITGALERHAGRLREVFTPTGPAWVLTGKNLQNLSKIILTGGYNATTDLSELIPYLKYSMSDTEGQTILLPDEYEYYRDNHYLIPLIANAALLYPKEAAESSIVYLIKES